MTSMAPKRFGSSHSINRNVLDVKKLALSLGSLYSEVVSATGSVLNVAAAEADYSPALGAWKRNVSIAEILAWRQAPAVVTQ